MTEAELLETQRNVIKLMDSNHELLVSINMLVKKLEISIWVCAISLIFGIMSTLGITVMRLTYHLTGKYKQACLQEVLRFFHAQAYESFIK